MSIQDTFSPQRLEELNSVVRRLGRGEDPIEVLTKKKVTALEMLYVWTQVGQTSPQDADLIRRLHPVVGPTIMMLFTPVFKE